MRCPSCGHYGLEPWWHETSSKLLPPEAWRCPRCELTTKAPTLEEARRARQTLIHVEPHGPTTLERAEQASSAGKRWAEAKADALRREIPAVDWPDAWEPESNGELPSYPSEVAHTELAALKFVAEHAAAEHWREIVQRQREAEDAGAEAHDEEAHALALLDVLRSDLPRGLSAGHDGPRVYLVDDDGTERTVDTLEQAWRVVAEYAEHGSLRTS